MLTIKPVELIQLIANSIGERDIYTLAKYINGTGTYNNAEQIALKHKFKLSQLKRDKVRKPYSKRLIHHSSAPCNTSSVYPLKTTDMPHEVTCTRCNSLMRIGNKL